MIKFVRMVVAVCLFALMLVSVHTLSRASAPSATRLFAPKLHNTQAIHSDNSIPSFHAPANLGQSAPITATYTEIFTSTTYKGYTSGIAWQADGLRLLNEDIAPQQYPAMATDRNGNTTVAWQDRRADDGDIYIQKFDARGIRIWPMDMRINATQTITSEQGAPAIAVTPDGNYALVAWWDRRNGDFDIYAQVVVSDGVRLWPDDLRVNSDPIGNRLDQIFPAVANVGDRFVVTWQEARIVPDSPYPLWNIMAQQLTTTPGKSWVVAPLVGGVPVAQENLSIQYRPAIAAISDTVVIAWQDTRAPAGTDIYAQRLNNNGERMWRRNGAIEDIRVSDPVGTSIFERYAPSIATDKDGNVVVAWVDTRTGTQFSIWANKLSQNGDWLWPANQSDPLRSTNRRVSGPFSNATFYKTAVTMDSSGNAYAAWEDLGPAVLMQKLDAIGNRAWLSDVNVSAAGIGAAYPSILIQPGDPVSPTAMVVWTKSNGPAGGIYARRFGASGEPLWVTPERISTPTGKTYVPFGEAYSTIAGSLGVTITRAVLKVECIAECGSVQYELSSNNGITWTRVVPNIPLFFNEETGWGKTLRWRATLESSADRTRTPIIKKLQIEYAYASPWTFMFYMAADNNLHGWLNGSLGALRRKVREKKENPNLNVNAIVLFDGNEQDDMYQEVINATSADSVGFNVFTVTETTNNMGDPKTLSSFIQRVREKYPAERYVLNIADHGRGALGVAWDSQGQPSSWRAGDYLSPSELHLALSTATLSGTQPLDIIHFDTCLGGLLEMAYEVKDFARYMVASESIVWTAFPFDDYVGAVPLTQTIEAKELAVRLADAYFAEDTIRTHPRTVSVLDLARVEQVYQAVNSFGNQLISTIGGSDGVAAAQTISQTRTDTQKFPGALDRAIVNHEESLDLYHFAEGLAREASLPSQVTQGALALMAAISNTQGLVIHSQRQSGGDRTFWDLQNSFGVSTYFPMQPTLCRPYIEYIAPGKLFRFTRQNSWPAFLRAFYERLNIPADGNCGVPTPPDTSLPPPMTPGPPTMMTPTATPTASPMPTVVLTPSLHLPAVMR